MSTTKVSAALMEAGTKGADIASTGTMVIGTDGSYFDITGTTGITAMTVDAGRIFTLQFDGAVTLTHSSTLYLAGAANFTTEANDHLTFVAVAANDVRQIGAGLKDGGSPVAAAGGVVLQVANAVNTSTASINSTTFADIPSLTVTLTPKNSSSKFLAFYNVSTGMNGDTDHSNIRLVRDSTNILIADSASSRTCSSSTGNVGAVGRMTSMGNSKLDSPSTASDVTFKLQWSNDGGANAYLNRSFRDNDAQGYDGRACSTLTVMEIAG
jgi:hypothetical protein